MRELTPPWIKRGKQNITTLCVAQDNADSGIVGKVQGFVKAGLNWLTTGRKRRGVLSSMQGMFLLQCSCHSLFRVQGS